MRGSYPDSMMASHQSLPRVIGVLHLLPLPGSPSWGGDSEDILAAATRDAEAYIEGGVDALIVENFGDSPFTRGRVDAEVVAAMARVATVLAPLLGDLPLGFNVLRNDARSALGLAASCGGSFVRVNVLTGAAVTDQGIIEGDAASLLRERQRLGLAAKVAIWADVHVKHAAPLGGGDIRDAARDTLGRGGADALIISGSGTGAPVDLATLALVRDAVPEAGLLIGSGATADTTPELLKHADGIIVGTAAKRDGLLSAPVDPDRVRRLVDAAGR